MGSALSVESGMGETVGLTEAAHIKVPEGMER